MRDKLNPGRIRGLTKPGVYGDGGGLYLQVRDATHRSWIFRFTISGKARWMGLGSFDDVSLSQAREAASAAKKLVKQGVDPIAQRDAEIAAKQVVAIHHTFDEVAALYIGAHEASWRNAKHRQQWRNTLDTYAKPTMGDTPIAAVDVGIVMKVLEPIWREKPETASRLRGRIEAVIDFATARGWRTGENPARWRGHLDHLLPARSRIAAVEHHPALPWQDMSTFWAKLAEQEGVSALALQFLILTTTRTNEALGARWGEIDLQSGVWTVPAGRMKAKREHRVPLSDEAKAVLTEAAKERPAKPKPLDPVFPGRKADAPLSNMALLMLLRRMKRGDLTAHGFRSSFRDWAAESTNYPRELAEAALAHVLKDKTEAAYQRGDLLEKRRRLMADWAKFCTRSAVAGEVVTLHALTG